MQLVERELLAAARVVTGCPVSTPRDPLLAEAGIPSAETRRKTLAARMLCRALSLPPDDPLRRVEEASPPQRLSSTSGWRRIGREALGLAGAEALAVEPRLQVTPAPWVAPSRVTFYLDVGHRGRRDAPADLRRQAAEKRLATLPSAATWIWSDGSAEDGVARGGGGAHITTGTGEVMEVKVAA